MIAGVSISTVAASALVAGAATPMGPSIVDKPADLRQYDESTVPPADEADIVAAVGEYKADGIVLTVKVQKPSDPLSDRNWRSEGTYIAWTLDVDGDGTEEFEAQYGVTDGQLGGAVYPINEETEEDEDEEEPKALCDLSSATYDATNGYTAVIPPKCIGSPSAVSYQVQFNYQSDPGDDSSQTWDLAPNSGLAGPLGIGIPVSPLVVPSTPTTGGQPPVTTSSSAPTTTTAPKTVRAPSDSRPTKAPSGAAKSPASSSAVAGPRSGAGAEDGTTAVPALARTGTADRTVRVAAFALGLALIGSGLLFANRRPPTVELR